MKYLRHRLFTCCPSSRYVDALGVHYVVDFIDVKSERAMSIVIVFRLTIEMYATTSRH